MQDSKKNDLFTVSVSFEVQVELYAESEFGYVGHSDAKADAGSLTSSLLYSSFLATSKFEIGLGSRGRGANGTSCPWT